MAKPHFELIFVPRTHGNVIRRFEEKLKSQDELREEVTRILAKESIIPHKIFITLVEEGKGTKKMGHAFEGFAKWRKYWGKIRGEKQGFLRDSMWKSDFYVYVLYGKERDGIMLTTEDQRDDEMKRIGASIYERLLSTMRKEGPLPMDRIVRSGTVAA